MNDFPRGIIMGAALWAFFCFGAFHLINALGWVESELAWGIIQLSVAVALSVAAFITNWDKE